MSDVQLSQHRQVLIDGGRPVYVSTRRLSVLVTGVSASGGGGGGPTREVVFVTTPDYELTSADVNRFLVFTSDDALTNIGVTAAAGAFEAGDSVQLVSTVRDLYFDPAQERTTVGYTESAFPYHIKTVTCVAEDTYQVDQTYSFSLADNSYFSSGIYLSGGLVFADGGNFALVGRLNGDGKRELYISNFPNNDFILWTEP